MLYFEVRLSTDEFFIQNSVRLMGIFALNVIVILSIIKIIDKMTMTILLHSCKKYFLLKLICFFSSYASWHMLELSGILYQTGWGYLISSSPVFQLFMAGKNDC